MGESGTGAYKVEVSLLATCVGTYAAETAVGALRSLDVGKRLLGFITQNHTAGGTTYRIRTQLADPGGTMRPCYMSGASANLVGVSSLYTLHESDAAEIVWLSEGTTGAPVEFMITQPWQPTVTSGGVSGMFDLYGVLLSEFP